MNRPNKHLCIATGQNLANLIPALQKQAAEVVILETPQMTEAAVNLKRALESHNIKVSRSPFDDSSPEMTRKSAEAVALELGEKPLVFNVTGGHKLMTLALFQALGDLADNLHVVYTETRHDRLEWLKPEPVQEKMENLLTVENILRVQGYRKTSESTADGWWQNQADERKELTKKLGDEAHDIAKFFGVLNKLADCALNEDGPFRAEQQLDYPPTGKQANLLKLASQLQLLDWDKERIVFRSADTAKYFRGGWLEEYVWLKLRGIKPHDFSVNLEVESFNKKAKNEMDIVVAHRNRLLVIECKTSGFGKNTIRDVGYIYKLAQLGNQVGGSMCKKLLLSARLIDDEVRQRAVEYGVDILAAAEVKALVNTIKAWMEE